MATPMTSAQMRAQLQKWLGPRLKEYPGWETRGRPQAWGPVYGVVVHHTGSDSQSTDYDKFLFVDGRSDLPAPLCNVATDMDGDLHLGAIGRANHAGAGSQSVLNHVVAEDYAGYTQELKPGPDGPIGNQYFYGNEVKYDGGQPMTVAQYDTAVRFAAAVCDFYGWTALSVIGHKEWTTRKPDPGNCNMAKFRSDVKARLLAGPGEDMALTDEDVVKLWSYKVGPPGDQESVGNVLYRIDPGGGGFAAFIRDAVWQFLSTSTRDNSAIKTLDLLRQAHGDSSRTIETLSEGGAINSQLDAIHSTLTDEDAQTDRIETAVSTPLDPATIAGIAAAVVAAMPPGEPVSQEALEAALRNVLGSLDGQ